MRETIMDMNLEISALAQSLAAQSAMGMLLVKVMDNAQQLVQQAIAGVAKSTDGGSSAVQGVGENLNVVA